MCGRLLLLVLASCCVLGVFGTTPVGYGSAGHVLTAQGIATITADITSTFGLSNAYGIQCVACTLGDNIGAMVRLAFHDIVGGGGPAGLGGADGCNDPLNGEKGLEAVLATYDILAARYARNISKADLWVLGAQIALKFASTTATGAGGGGGQSAPASPGALSLTFNYGRLDREDCSGLDAPFTSTISGAMDWTALFALLGHRFGMTVQEAVAIMGAHSLGRCQAANSGFEGGWTTLQSSLTNVYYSSLGNIGWNQPDRTLPEWDANPGGTKVLMIGPDMDILFANPSGCPRFNSFTSCTQNTAEGNGEPAASVIRFAGSMSLWYASFATAWQKMTEFQWTGKLAAPGSVLPGATTPSTSTTVASSTASAARSSSTAGSTTRSSSSTASSRSSSTASSRSSSTASSRSSSTAAARSSSTGGIVVASSTGSSGGSVYRLTMYVSNQGGCQSQRSENQVESQVKAAIVRSQNIDSSRVIVNAVPDRPGRCKVFVTLLPATSSAASEAYDSVVASITEGSILFDGNTTIDRSEGTSGIVDSQELSTCSDGSFVPVGQECPSTSPSDTNSDQYPVVGTLANLIVVCVGAACILLAVVWSCWWCRHQRTRGQPFCACCGCCQATTHTKTVEAIKTGQLTSPHPAAPAGVELSAVGVAVGSGTGAAPGAADDEHSASTETTPISPRSRQQPRTYMAAV